MGGAVAWPLRSCECPAIRTRARCIAAPVAALIGPLFFRRWFSREPLTEAFVAEIARRVMPGAA
jgi:hypothetical protein